VTEVSFYSQCCSPYISKCYPNTADADFK